MILVKNCFLIPSYIKGFNSTQNHFNGHIKVNRSGKRNQHELDLKLRKKNPYVLTKYDIFILRKSNNHRQSQGRRQRRNNHMSLCSRHLLFCLVLIKNSM